MSKRRPVMAVFLRAALGISQVFFFDPRRSGAFFVKKGDVMGLKKDGFPRGPPKKMRDVNLVNMGKDEI